MKAIVNEYEAPFWGEDFQEHDLFGDNDKYDDGGDDNWPDDEDDEPVADINAPAAVDNREPVWSIRLDMTGGEELLFMFYDEPDDKPLMLFQAINELFAEDDNNYSGRSAEIEGGTLYE